jgi:hypothetical protein
MVVVVRAYTSAVEVVVWVVGWWQLSEAMCAQVLLPLLRARGCAF